MQKVDEKLFKSKMKSKIYCDFGWERKVQRERVSNTENILPLFQG